MRVAQSAKQLTKAPRILGNRSAQISDLLNIVDALDRFCWSVMTAKTSGINKSKSVASVPRPPSHWHAVCIKPKGIACEAVQAYRAARFLSREAPRLPLPECTASDTCNCVYKHHADRRAQPRRQAERDGLRRSNQVDQERRLSRDRRKSD